LRKAELALKRVEDEDIACSHDSGSLSGKAYANDPAAAIKKATLKPKKSTFADCWDDPAFCHEVVVAQQLCENFVEDGADSPKSIMLKRFRLKPELAKYRSLVEAHFAEFVSEPLPVAAQMKGWQKYLQVKFQADYASNDNDLKPDLVKAIVSNDVQRVLKVLNDNRAVVRDVLFAPYGQVSNQSVLLDALRIGPFAVVELLLEHGYPVATQIVGSSESGTWPLLHYLLIAWAELVCATPTKTFPRCNSAFPTHCPSWRSTVPTFVLLSTGSHRSTLRARVPWRPQFEASSRCWSSAAFLKATRSTVPSATRRRRPACFRRWLTAQTR
jgi:hypothetical protein